LVPHFGTIEFYTDYIKRKRDLQMKTLLINAHPDFSNNAHYSIKLQNAFIERFNQTFPANELTILNLYNMELPRLEPQLFAIQQKKAFAQELTADERALDAKATQLLEQFKSHHRIVIVMPLHNFNITSRLKDYLDAVMVPRETYRYLAAPDAHGKASTGLMTDDYKAMLLLGTGSVYTKGFYTALDFAAQYLDSMFHEIMGFGDFLTIRAEGTAVSLENDVLSPAFNQLDENFENFYRTD
jgi:FMN-dependent NADH-azoreductase